MKITHSKYAVLSEIKKKSLKVEVLRVRETKREVGREVP